MATASKSRGSSPKFTSRTSKYSTAMCGGVIPAKVSKPRLGNASIAFLRRETPGKVRPRFSSSTSQSRRPLMAMNPIFIAPPVHQQHHDSRGGADHRQREKNSKPSAPGGEKTANWHGDCARNHQDRRDSRNRHQNAAGKTKKNVGKSQAEKRNVTEPKEATPIRRVAAEPFLALKKKADHRAGNDTGECGGPTGPQVPLCKCRLHGTIVRQFEESP